jgi:hypothetical protein
MGELWGAFTWQLNLILILITPQITSLFLKSLSIIKWNWCDFDKYKNYNKTRKRLNSASKNIDTFWRNKNQIKRSCFDIFYSHHIHTYQILDYLTWRTK